MLQQKLIIGRYIDLTLVNNAVPPYDDGAFVTVPVHPCYLRESRGIFKKKSSIQQGAGPKGHRNFHWLPWLPGAISETPLQGTDVLTGPMSGCWLVTYRRAGVTYAGHLGTDVASVERTDAVNDTWNTWATANEDDVIGGFNPLRHWVGDFPAKLPGEPALPPKIFGLYTTTNQYYVMVCYQQTVPATMLRIAGIRRVDSSSKVKLKHVDEPGI